MLRIEYGVPRSVAPAFVQIPRWNGRLNVYRGRPSERPHNPLGEAVIWQAIQSGVEARIPTPSRVPGFRWSHEIEAV